MPAPAVPVAPVAKLGGFAVNRYTVVHNPHHWNGPRWELRDGKKVVDGSKSKGSVVQMQATFQKARDEFNKRQGVA